MSWLTHLPAPLRPYAQLMRLDQPTGFWLLVFPAWWALALYAPLQAGPDFSLVLRFLLGAILMRGAGCIVNDLFDRKMDAAVQRTASRPLATGAVSSRAAIILAIILALAGFGIALTMNLLTVLMAAAVLPLIIAYPLMKRFTWWPQAFLGLTFNWGVFLGTAASLDMLTLSSAVLYAACFFWTLGYDTIYAFQDVKDDEKAGIKSTARLFGAKARSWVGFFYGACWVLLTLAGIMHGLGLGFYIGMVIAIREFVGQLTAWRMEDAENSAAIFKSNVVLGWIVLFAFVAGHYF